MNYSIEARLYDELVSLEGLRQEEPVGVVVADDDALQRAYTSAVLRKLGYAPVEAANGTEALDLIRGGAAQILVCDLDMPGIDGHELAREVRRDPGDTYIHILMLTAQNQGHERERALEAGVDDFMAKPLDTASLTARMRSADRLLQRERQLATRNRVLAEAKEQIEADLRAAADAQRRLLPAAHARVGGCAFHSAFMPSHIMSGDMFGYFPLGDGLTGFYAVDVAGHGVHASLMSVALGHLLTADYFRGHVFDAEGNPDPAELVRALNARFYTEDGTEYFTMFAGIVDATSDTLHFCQAGYPSPCIMTHSGACRRVGDGGFPVALISSASFESGAISLREGEFLALSSDGATEAEDPAGTAFGDEGLAQVFKASAAEPEAITGKLVDALTRWRATRPLDDDLTVLVCERIAAS